MNKTEEILDIINDLNEKLFDEEATGKVGLFSLDTDGYCTNVCFGMLLIWSSEDDEREFIEEKNDYEPLKEFLIKRVNAIGNDLKFIANILNEKA